MYANLTEFLQDLLGDDHSARNIVEFLERDGFLSSPLPRWTAKKRPFVDGANPAISAGDRDQ